MTTPREIVARVLRNTTYRVPDAILTALASNGFRLVGPGEIDDLAAALWREEAVDSGTPASVAAGRTRTSFDDQSDTLKARWRKFAAVAIRALSQETKP